MYRDNQENDGGALLKSAASNLVMVVEASLVLSPDRALFKNPFGFYTKIEKTIKLVKQFGEHTH